MSINYYKDLPDYIKRIYPNFTYNNIYDTLEIKKNIHCIIKILHIKKLYDDDDIFYISTDKYLIMLFVENKTYSIINKLKR